MRHPARSAEVTQPIRAVNDRRPRGVEQMTSGRNLIAIRACVRREHHRQSSAGCRNVACSRCPSSCPGRPAIPPPSSGVPSVSPNLPLDTVAVIGLGYIGLPTAAVLAQAGKTVIGVDVSQATVEAINAGTVPFVEEGL